MRIQRLFSIIFLTAAVSSVTFFTVGMYQEFRKQEEDRTEELATNMLRNMLNGMEGIVAKIDFAMAWLEEDNVELSDEMLFRMFDHLHVRDILRLDQPQAYLWPIAGDTSIVSRHIHVNDRIFEASYVMRDESLLPMLRISPAFDNSGHIRSLYFSPRALMDFNLVSRASVMAYDQYSGVVGGIYPVSLYGAASSSLLIKTRLVKDFFESTGSLPPKFEVDGYQFINFPDNGSSGFLVARKIKPWHALSWLPQSIWWWLVIAGGTILLLLILRFVVMRYISQPISLVSRLILRRSLPPDEMSRVLSGRLVPGEIRSLMYQARQLVADKHGTSEVPGPAESLLVSESTFMRRAQQATMTDALRRRGMMFITLGDPCVSDGAISDEMIKERLDRVVTEVNGFSRIHLTSSLGLATCLMGEKGLSGLWLWVETDASLEMLGERMQAHLKSSLNDTWMGQGGLMIHIMEEQGSGWLALDMADYLLFSVRHEEWNPSHRPLVIVDSYRQDCRRDERLLNHLAASGFEKDQICLLMTPVIRNGTGEVRFLRVRPHVNIESGKFPARSGEWMVRDHHGTFLAEVLRQAILMARLVDRSDFSLVRLSLPLDARWLDCPQVLSGLADMEEHILSRLVLEIPGKPLSPDHYRLLRRLSDKGVGFAIHCMPGYGSSLGLPVAYTFLRGCEYQGMMKLYHQTLKDGRELGDVMVDLGSAGEMLHVSSFYQEQDLSVVADAADLSLGDAIRFLQKDIANNVLRSGEKKTVDLNDRPVNVVEFRAVK